MTNAQHANENLTVHLKVKDCPSSEILRHRAALIKRGSGSLVDDVTRLAVGAASGVQ